MVSGDMGAFKRKHMGEIQTIAPNVIETFILDAGKHFDSLSKQKEELKQIEVTRQIQAELVGRMLLQEKIIKMNQLAIIRDQLENPTFDYGAKNSMWELYQHTTYAMREAHPSLWMKQHTDVHEFFVKENGLFVPTTEELVIPDNQLELFQQSEV